MDKTIESGFYSAAYFNKAKTILSGLDVPVTMQVFQKNHVVLYGINEAVSVLRGSSEGGKYLEIKALRDGDEAAPWETVMTIKGNLADFVHLESVYLGILARGTRVATNMRKVVEAAGGKPVLFMGDRFDRYENQYSDGEAALIAGASAICTDAMGYRNMVDGQGTMPHALIAAFGGDVVEACKAYHKAFPDEKITALVDFNNDCVWDSIRCVKEFGPALGAVRLDTSENMMDVSIAKDFVQYNDPLLRQWRKPEYSVGDFKPTGVNPRLVQKVRQALDENGGQHVKIVVSGGFSPERIRAFEAEGVPVDVYGVGSGVMKTGGDFTADVVEPVSKAGRRLRPNPRLREV